MARNVDIVCNEFVMLKVVECTIEIRRVMFPDETTPLEVLTQHIRSATRLTNSTPTSMSLDNTSESADPMGLLSHHCMVE